MGRRDGPTGGGAFHVGTVQRHYKKIFDVINLFQVSEISIVR